MKTVLPFRIWTNCQSTILNLPHPLSQTSHFHQVTNHHQQVEVVVVVAWDSNQATVTSHQLLGTYLEQVLIQLVSYHLISSVQHQWHNNKITIQVWCRVNLQFTIHLKIKTSILLPVAVVWLSQSLRINKMLICTYHPMIQHPLAIITLWTQQPRQMVWVTRVGAVQTVVSLTWAIIWIIIRSEITIISINKLIIQSMILKPGLRL